MDVYIVPPRSNFYEVAYLDLTGSGNETSAHLKENGMITLMFVAFEGTPDPAIVWKRERDIARFT